MMWPEDKYEWGDLGWGIVGGVGLFTIVVFLICVCVGMVTFTHHVITGEFNSPEPECSCEKEE